MKLKEFLDQTDLETAYYDPAKDKAHIAKYDQTRRPRLTLHHLNKLKRMRALEKLENLKRQDLLGIMYGVPEEPEGGGMGGLGGPPGM